MSRVSAHLPLVRLMATITQVTVSLIPGYNHHFLPVWDRFGGQIPWLSPSAAVPGRLMTTITQVTASLIPGYKHHFLSVWDGFWGQLPWLSPSAAVSVRSMTTIKAITQVTVSLIQVTTKALLPSVGLILRTTTVAVSQRSSASQIDDNHYPDDCQLDTRLQPPLTPSVGWILRKTTMAISYIVNNTNTVSFHKNMVHFLWNHHKRDPI